MYIIYRLIVWKRLEAADILSEYYQTPSPLERAGVRQIKSPTETDLQGPV